MEQIIVTINKDGSFQYEVQGIQGASCRDVTKFIDDLGRVSETKNTSEFFQAGDGQGINIGGTQ